MEARALSLIHRPDIGAALQQDLHAVGKAILGGPEKRSALAIVKRIDAAPEAEEGLDAGRVALEGGPVDGTVSIYVFDIGADDAPEPCDQGRVSICGCEMQRCLSELRLD